MKANTIDIDLIAKYIEYDSESGALTYKATGKQCLNRSNGYIRLWVNNKAYYGHRIAWLLTHKDLSNSLEIDHKNGDRSDNRICNLRLATTQQNRVNSKSKPRGIFQVCGKWRAQTKVKGKCINIGTYECPLIAHLAYKDKMIEMHGEFVGR